VLVTVTSAPTMEAPLASMTRPRNVADDAANAKTESASRNNAAGANRTNENIFSPCLIFPDFLVGIARKDTA
jgi:hypothetical protein